MSPAISRNQTSRTAVTVSECPCTIPTPFPTWGGVLISNHPLLTKVLSFFAFVCHPRLRSVLPFTRLSGCARPRGRAPPKPPSSLTRQTGSPTDGIMVLKDRCPFCNFTSLTGKTGLTSSGQSRDGYGTRWRGSVQKLADSRLWRAVKRAETRASGLRTRKTLTGGMSGRAGMGLLLRGIPCPPAKIRSYGFCGLRRRLVSFCLPPGIPPLPLNPAGGSPPAAKRPKTADLRERTGEPTRQPASQGVASARSPFLFNPCPLTFPRIQPGFMVKYPTGTSFPTNQPQPLKET